VSSQMRTSPTASPIRQGSPAGDLDSYLDAVGHAPTIFRSAVEAYMQSGPEGACWQQAKRISEHMRLLDGLQRRLEAGARGDRRENELICRIIDPLGGLTRLLKEMKRQITGYAIESGFTGPGRCVPDHLLGDVHVLTGEVCAAISALVRRLRVCLSGEESASTFRCEPGVAWHEGEADRLSMLLLKRIFADERLDLETKLLLGQFVEEIDRLADHAERLDSELLTYPVDGATQVRVIEACKAHERP